MRVLLPLVELLLLAAGCYGPLPRIRMYPGQPLPADQAAIVQPEWDDVHVLLDKLDDAPVRHSGEYGIVQEVEITPGSHTLECGYIRPMGFHWGWPLMGAEISGKTRVVPFAAAPGGHYVVRALRTSAVWLGSHFDWTAWVVDVRTDEVVGGEPPPMARTGYGAR